MDDTRSGILRFAKGGDALDSYGIEVEGFLLTNDPCSHLKWGRTSSSCLLVQAAPSPHDKQHTHERQDDQDCPNDQGGMQDGG